MNSTETLSRIGAALTALSEKSRSQNLAETINGKKERTFHQRETLKMTNTTFPALKKICAELGINTGEGRSWRVKLSDVHKIWAHQGIIPFRRKAEDKIAIWTIATLKGGSGKTTIATNTAVGLASEYSEQFSVLLIDLDPQATATALIKPNMSDGDFSVGDLLIGEDENDGITLDEDESFDELCRESCLETNIPNLKILPARLGDARYERVVKGREIEADKTGGHYDMYGDLQRIIDAVEGDYDIIIIDTAPQLSASSMQGMYVANGLIVPLRASENDRDAAGTFITELAETDRILTAAGQREKDDVSVIISAVDTTSKAQIKIANEIRQEIGQWCYSVNFIQSDAVTNCAKAFCTPFDISPSSVSSKGSLVRFQDHTKIFLDEVKQKIESTWSNK